MNEQPTQLSQPNPDKGSQNTEKLITPELQQMVSELTIEVSNLKSEMKAMAELLKHLLDASPANIGVAPDPEPTDPVETTEQIVAREKERNMDLARKILTELKANKKKKEDLNDSEKRALSFLVRDRSSTPQEFTETANVLYDTKSFCESKNETGAKVLAAKGNNQAELEGPQPAETPVDEEKIIHSADADRTTGGNGIEEPTEASAKKVEQHEPTEQPEPPAQARIEPPPVPDALKTNEPKPRGRNRAYDLGLRIGNLARRLSGQTPAARPAEQASAPRTETDQAATSTEAVAAVDPRMHAIDVIDQETRKLNLDEAGLKKLSELVRLTGKPGEADSEKYDLKRNAAIRKLESYLDNLTLTTADVTGTDKLRETLDQATIPLKEVAERELEQLQTEGYYTPREKKTDTSKYEPLPIYNAPQTDVTQSGEPVANPNQSVEPANVTEPPAPKPAEMEAVGTSLSEIGGENVVPTANSVNGRETDAEQNPIIGDDEGTEVDSNQQTEAPILVTPEVTTDPEQEQVDQEVLDIANAVIKPSVEDINALNERLNRIVRQEQKLQRARINVLTQGLPYLRTNPESAIVYLSSLRNEPNNPENIRSLEELKTKVAAEKAANNSATASPNSSNS